MNDLVARGWAVQRSLGKMVMERSVVRYLTTGLVVLEFCMDVQVVITDDLVVGLVYGLVDGCGRLQYVGLLFLHSR